MQTISLDKSISLSRGIMNKEINIPDFVKVMGIFKPMDRFRFVDSDVELPIEHLGLAVLSYQNAVEQYTFTKVEQDPQTGEKTETQLFEPLHEGQSHISDFLSSIMPDALNWYSGTQGIYEMNFYSSFVPCMSPKDYNQCKVFNDKGEDLRELAITEAYRQAVRGYVGNAVEGKEDTQDFAFVATLHDFMENDALNFQEMLEDLRTQSGSLVLHLDEQDSGDQTSKDGQETDDNAMLDPENIQDQDTIRTPNIPLDNKGGAVTLHEDSFIPPEQ